MAELTFELNVLRSQIRYQLTLLARNPRALMTALVLPAMILALELGKVQHLGSTPTGMAVLAPRIAGLFVGLAASLLFFRWDPSRPAHAR